VFARVDLAMHNTLRLTQLRTAVLRGIVVPFCLFALAASAVSAQTTTVPQGAEHPGAACPPSPGPNAPTVGKPDGKTLTDQLAQSKGVICPPAGVDPEMRQKPPEGGALRVIPPPGTAQNPGAQAK
jgi:hypothetical protein